MDIFCLSNFPQSNCKVQVIIKIAFINNIWYKYTASKLLFPKICTDKSKQFHILKTKIYFSLDALKLNFSLLACQDVLTPPCPPRKLRGSS